MNNDITETKEDIKIIINSWIETGFKLSMALGAFISWAFFSFFVNALPSLGSIGDIAIYLISISAWSLIITFYIVAMSFASSFLIKSASNLNDYSNNYLAKYYIVFPIFSTIILLISNKLNFTQEIVNIVISVLFFLSPIIYSLFVTELHPRRNLKNIDRFFNRINDIGLPLILFSLILFLIALMLDKISDDWNNQFWIYLISIVAIILLNYFIIKGEIKNWKIAFAIVITYIVIIFIVFAALKINNPIIVKPFQVLKLGFYQSELRFKDDFINKSNPFLLNENNQTSNTFFILSSIGDEYILQETRKSLDYNESKNTHHYGLYPFDYNGTRYYCEDDNQSLIWSAPSSNNNYIHKIKNRTRDFNETIEKQSEYWKTIDQKIYRIKKENVAFESSGKEIDTQSTVWKHNAKE